MHYYMEERPFEDSKARPDMIRTQQTGSRIVSTNICADVLPFYKPIHTSTGVVQTNRLRYNCAMSHSVRRIFSHLMPSNGLMCEVCISFPTDVVNRRGMPALAALMGRRIYPLFRQSWPLGKSKNRERARIFLNLNY